MWIFLKIVIKAAEQPSSLETTPLQHAAMLLIAA